MLKANLEKVDGEIMVPTKENVLHTNPSALTNSAIITPLMSWVELDREKNIPHAFRIAAEAVQQVFELPSDLQVLDWVNKISDDVHYKDDGVRAVWFSFRVDDDPEKPLDIVVYLKHTIVSQSITVDDNPPPNYLGADRLLMLNSKYEDKPIKIEGIVPGLWKSGGALTKQNQIRPETHVFTITLEGDDKKLEWHADMPF